MTTRKMDAREADKTVLAILRRNPGMAVESAERALIDMERARERRRARWPRIISTLADLTQDLGYRGPKVELEDLIEIIQKHPEDLIGAVRSELKRREEDVEKERREDERGIRGICP